VYPKMYPGLRVKYMENIKIHVFSWNVTGHLKYIWDTSGYMSDTCILQDTVFPPH